MNAALCCAEPSARVLPFSGLRRLLQAVCGAAVAWLDARRTAHATWRELRLLDERSLAETGVTPAHYWPLDRTNRL